MKWISFFFIKKSKERGREKEEERIGTIYIPNLGKKKVFVYKSKESFFGEFQENSH
jgi:hypothetical protein